MSFRYLQPDSSGERRLSFRTLIGRNNIQKERLKLKQQLSVMVLLTSGRKLRHRWLLKKRGVESQLELPVEFLCGPSPAHLSVS